MRQKNKFESQGGVGPIQDGCKTSNDVRFGDMFSEESTREEIGEYVKMAESGHQAEAGQK